MNRVDSSSTLVQLPIDDHLPHIIDLLKKHQNVVLSAAPGSGKTTRLPPALLNQFQKKILVLEPRRIAALAAADRISQENNWQLGGNEIGYQVRFDNCSTTNTRLLFLTEALLTRKMLDDASLNDIDVVVLDEFHERSLHVDLAIGLIKELQELSRPDLKMVIMSATLDVEKLKNTLPDTVCYQVPGNLYPLTIEYQKKEMRLQTRQDFIETVCDAAASALQKLNDSESMLIFLPGKSEIDRCADFLSEKISGKISDIQICKLHGQIPLSEQRQILQKSLYKKIIFSTNIAESSLTVDGVRIVIDSGLQRRLSVHAQTGFAQLELTRISKASATQRAGRAARQAPGLCYRLWNKMDEISMPDHEQAEILNADLTSSLLFLAQQKISDFQNFSWFEKPPKENIDKAQMQLRFLSCLDTQNQISPTGEKILRLPIDPRLARAVISADNKQVLKPMCEIAALLSESEARQKLLGKNRATSASECDLWYLWEIYQEKGSARIEQAAKQIYNQCRNTLADFKPNKKTPEHWSPNILHEILLEAFPDRLCLRRKVQSDHGPIRAQMIGGRGVTLDELSQVKKSEFFIAMDLFEASKISSNNETQVLLACGLERVLVEKYFANYIEKKNHIELNEQILRFEKRIQFHINLSPMVQAQTPMMTTDSKWSLLIREQQPQPLSTDEIGDSLLLWLQEQIQMIIDQLENIGLDHKITENILLLKHNEAFYKWLQRYRFFCKHKFCDTNSSENKISNTLSEQSAQSSRALQKISSQQWLQICELVAMGKSQPQQIFDCDIISHVESIWGREFMIQFNDLCPDKIQVPSGSRIAIQYTDDNNPSIEVRLQEIFGWSETPKIMNNKIPLVISLLAPNYRPVQITKDLKSFWSYGYVEVKKELKARYPKHSWPDDPLSAVAVAKGGIKR